MATSVRLDVRLEALISQLAKRRGQTKSEVIRSAIEQLEQQEHVEQRSPYEAMQHLLGCATGGPPDLSMDTGRKLRERLLARRKSP